MGREKDQEERHQDRAQTAQNQGGRRRCKAVPGSTHSAVGKAEASPGVFWIPAVWLWSLGWEDRK